VPWFGHMTKKQKYKEHHIVYEYASEASHGYPSESPTCLLSLLYHNDLPRVYILPSSLRLRYTRAIVQYEAPEHSFGRPRSISLDFTVDGSGAGTVRIGAKDYAIQSDPAISGGITCGRLSSTDGAVISCDVPVPASLQLRGLSKRDLPTCRTTGSNKLYNIMAGFERNKIHVSTWSSNITSAELPSTSPVAHTKRQGSCGVWSQATNQVGDGDPHQNPLNIQLSVRITSLSLPLCAKLLLTPR